jgi:hypothetical protein
MKVVLVLFLAAVAMGAAIPAAAQTGACCPPPCYNCTITTEAGCDSLGGYYLGDGSICEPAP